MNTVMWLGGGRLVNPWNLLPELQAGKVTLEDIAHALARINRWTGHTRTPISVGAHTLICVEAARRQSRQLARLALHHENGEVFFNDLPWAIKKHPSMVAYRAAEHTATRQCIDHFCPSLRGVSVDAIKPIDTACVMWEMSYFLPEGKDLWDHPAPETPLIPEIAYWNWTPDAVAARWLATHYELQA
jgi:hypothetical protein